MSCCREDQEELNEFFAHAIKVLSLALMTGDYDVNEVDEIFNIASVESAFYHKQEGY